MAALLAVIVSFSHPGRCRNDAAFAALAGASPLEASSGRTVRHRLNRGGDRALNRALHTIAVTRMRSCPITQAYVARRTAEGKNPRQAPRHPKGTGDRPSRASGRPPCTPRPTRPPTGGLSTSRS